MNKFLRIIFILCFISKSNSSINSDLSNVLTLTSNFFSNLNSIGNDLTEETQNFIDDQIDHYVDLVKRSHGIISKSKSRRSIFNEDINILSMDFIGVYVLNGFFEQTRIPVKYPIDIALFKHDFGSNEIWYAATLQSNNIRNKEADNLIIYRYEDENYMEISNITVAKGTRISVHATHGKIYIVIAENLLNSRISIFLFDIEENLYKIQTLDVSNISDVAIWEQNNEIFIGATQEMVNVKNNIFYEVKSLIFKQFGKHFKFVQNIDTIGAKKIISFAIGNDQFLAVANHKNNIGETEIFTEIFKYDTSEEKFNSYQKILTHAVVDIQYFCFKQNDFYESFIVVANSYELDTEGNINYETSSIIYKFVEDYFMPFQSFTLNYADKWLPVAGPNGEFILLVSTKNDGTKAFQYDGWRFIESEVQYTGEAFGSGIINFRSYLYNIQPVIVVANKNDYGNMLNIFSPTFTYQNVMNELEMSMHEWCQHVTNDVETDEMKELNRLIEEAPKVDDLEIQFKNKLYFHNVTIFNLVIDDENVNSKRTKKSNEIIQMEQQIDKKSEQINQINEKLRNNEPITLNGNVKVKSLEISNDDRIIFEDMQTTAINNVQLDEFFNDIINLNDPFTLNDEMDFEDIIFDGVISPKFLNNVPKDALLHTSSNASINNNLSVHGNVIVEDIIVGEYLDGIEINENNILLTEGDQILSGTLMFSEIETKHLNMKYINNIDMINMEPNHIVNVTEHSIESLTVKNVTVSKINGIDMDIFYNLVLRTRGDQEIISNYEFDTLIVDDFEVDDLLSGTNLSSLVLISDTTNFIPQPLFFTEDLETKYLHVMTSLNQIPVYNGKLDILLKDHSQVQYISGKKIFESINLSGPIQLRGQIKIKGLDPPIITKNLTLSGDYTINGDTVIDKIFMFNDLAEPSGTYTMERLETEGLKLTDSEIPNNLFFTQGLTVDEIELDKINNIDVNSWIIFENKPSEITGTKIFEEHLNINGVLNVLAINGHNLKKLYDNILRIDSDQIVTGQHTYSSISAIRVVSNKTFINNAPLEEIMTIEGDQHISGTTTLSEPIKIFQFEANFAELKGKIKNYNFTKMVADTAFNDTINIVTGNKFFEETVFFKNMNVDFINEVSLHKLLSEINQWIGDVHLKDSINMKKLKVNDLYFEELNGLKREEFGNIWLLKEGRQTVYEKQYFETVICKNELNIESNLINEINIGEIDELSVKTNKEHHFTSVHFVNGVKSAQSVTVGGKLQNINIDDVVLTKEVHNQTLHGNKAILKNLTVDGYLHVNGLLSGVNLTLIEKLTESSNIKKEIKLVVDGNINFKHEFAVKSLNNIDIENLAKNAWFTDQEANIKGYIAFENIIFEKDLQVDGYVDDIPIVWFSNNYFSKTKDQNISARLDFVDGIIFSQNIEAEKALVSGLVANISLQEFNKHILRNDDQIFDFEIKFDNVKVTDEFDAKLINNLDLSTDVMRNDLSENIVTGHKIIKNLNVINLDVEEGKKVQNVDVDDWFKNAVLLDGSYTIDGLTAIKNAKFEKNIELLGLLNSHTFNEEHIMTTNTKQKIIGKKNFITSESSPLTFHNLKLKGLINDINIDKLIEIQIDKSKDIIPISSNKQFYNTLSASNINFEQLYQGINVVELFKNVNDLGNLNNYAEEYDKLVYFASNILGVLKQQSHFLDTFIQIQKLDVNTQDVITIQEYENSTLVLITNNSETLSLSMYSWNTKLNKFDKKNGGTDIKIEEEITFISKLEQNNKNYLYVESKTDQNPGNTNLGIIYEISTGNSITQFATNKTVSQTIISMPDQQKNCLLNVQNNFANIYCNNEETIELYQQLQIVNGLKSSSINIKNIPYIFIVNAETKSTDSTIQIWKYDTNNLNFIIHQIITISNPSGIDSIFYNNEYYLTVGIRHKVETGNPGLVIIYKYDVIGDMFKECHKIAVIDPSNVKFGILSSDELVLYVLSNCPAEPLIVYLYEGISGIEKKFSTAALPIITTVNNLLTDNTDFVVVSNEKEVRIIKALFKGKK